MRYTGHVSRRQALRLTAGTAATALVAGCLGGSETSGEDERADGDSSGDGDEDPAGEPDADGPTGGPDDGDENETESTNAAEADEERDTPTGGEAWTDVEEIVLSATTAGWTGIEPKRIEGEKNPTLVLAPGREYVITWKNADGQPHNVEIWDDNGEVVDDYVTELMATEGATQSLEIEADERMAEYVCEIHADWGQCGHIEIERP